MKTLLFAAATIVVSHLPSWARDVSPQALAREMATEYAECSFYYNVMSELERRPDVTIGSPERATQYRTASDKMGAIVFALGKQIGYTTEQAASMIADANQRFAAIQAKGRAVAFFAQMRDFCLRLYQNPDGRVDEVGAGNICNRDYPCRTND